MGPSPQLRTGAQQEKSPPPAFSRFTAISFPPESSMQSSYAVILFEPQTLGLQLVFPSPWFSPVPSPFLLPGRPLFWWPLYFVPPPFCFLPFCMERLFLERLYVFYFVSLPEFDFQRAGFPLTHVWAPSLSRPFFWIGQQFGSSWLFFPFA